MGTGAQARLQIEAAHLVRPFERVLVWGRDPAKAAACASDIGKALGIEARAESDPERLVNESQLVVTATPTEEPVLKANWLHPGLHVTAMGSDQEGKNEIEPEALVRADAYVCDRVSQCELVGELAGAIRGGCWTAGRPVELGDVVAGTADGRIAPGDVTICDLTGTGAQDTAIAMLALAKAKGAGKGATIRV